MVKYTQEANSKLSEALIYNTNISYIFTVTRENVVNVATPVEGHDMIEHKETNLLNGGVGERAERRCREFCLDIRQLTSTKIYNSKEAINEFFQQNFNRTRNV